MLRIKRRAAEAQFPPPSALSDKRGRRHDEGAQGGSLLQGASDLGMHPGLDGVSVHPVARQKRFSGRDVGRGVKFWVAGGEGCGVLVVTGWPESSEGPGPEGHLSHGEEFWLCPKYSREPSRCCEQE